MSLSEGHSTGPPVQQDGGRGEAWAGQWLLGWWTAPGPPTPAKPSSLCPHLRLPSGLEDVSKYPDLVAELLRRQWTEEEVKGALAVNLLRVFEAVEKVSRLLGSLPSTPTRHDSLTLWRAGRQPNRHLSPGEQSHTTC